MDAQDDVGLPAQLLQKLKFHIGVKARKNARRVIIVNQLAAKFKIQTPARLINPSQNRGFLLFQITLIIKSRHKKFQIREGRQQRAQCGNDPVMDDRQSAEASVGAAEHNRPLQ